MHNKASETGYTTPYKFTGKEQDPETGLYYYGARYYDPVLSRWVSTDPPMMTGEYLPSAQDMIAAEDQGEEYRPEQSLPGMGGVYNSTNIDMYHYAGQNPVKLVDPDGNQSLPALEMLYKRYNITTATEQRVNEHMQMGAAYGEGFSHGFVDANIGFPVSRLIPTSSRRFNQFDAGYELGKFVGTGVHLKSIVSTLGTLQLGKKITGDVVKADLMSAPV